MTQAVAAPPPMPGISQAQAVAASALAEPSDGADGAADFAAVLQAQFGLTAKDAPGAENLAALLPGAAASAVPAEATPATEEAPAAPDLTALLPHLAGLAPATPAPPAAAIEGAPARQAAGPAAPSIPLAGSGEPLGRQPIAADIGLETAMAHSRQAPVPEARQAEAALQAAAEPQMPAASVASAASEHAAQAATTHAAAPLALARAAEHVPAVLRLDTPVGSRGWDAELGQKVVLLVGRQESRAELTLTPPQLGRLEISITVSGDQTSAAFVSASPAAREALEQALPRLREILAEAGIALGEASVHAESSRQDGQGTASQGRDGNGHGHSSATAEAGVATPWQRRSEGLVDTFA